MNGVGQEAIRLLLFPFSLRDGALEWLHSLPEGSITTWTELYNQFLQEFFPYSKVRDTQDQIDHFKQRHGESLYEAWRRFKALLRKVPNRERPPVDSFFMGLLPPVMKEVNAAAGGAFMHQDRHDAWRFLERMALSDCQLPGDRHTTPMKVEAVASSSENSDLSNKLDTVLQHIASMSLHPNRYNQGGPSGSENIQNVEEAQYVGEKGFYLNNPNQGYQQDYQRENKYGAPH